MHYPAEVQIIFEDTIERLRGAGMNSRVIETLAHLLERGELGDIERIEAVLLELDSEKES